MRFLASTVALEDILTTVSATLAAAAMLAAAAAGIHQTIAAQNAVDRVHEASPEAAISELSLSALGDYIYGTLGSIPIAEYASNPGAHGDVARALEAIEAFITEDSALAEGAFTDDAARQSLAAAHSALGRQDTWQALAQLRRSIEIELRRFAEQRDVRVPPRAGAGRLLRLLEQHRAIRAEAIGPLRSAIDVSSRAIHGEEVSAAVAEDALFAAAQALKQLQQSGSQFFED